MKSKHLLLTLLLALLVPWAANAQTVTIGTGTSTQNMSPVANYYNYSLTEMIYTASEIAAGEPTENHILSVGFQLAANGLNNKTYSISIYMKNVDADQFASAEFTAVSSEDLVYDGTMSATASGWVTLTLDTPFQYDVTKNLLIAINKTAGSYAGNAYNWNYTSTSSSSLYQHLYKQNDSDGAYDPTNPQVTPTRNYNRPNVQLTFGTPPTCFAPQNLTCTEYTATSATLTWQRHNLGTENAWVLQYSTDNTFASGVQSVNVSNTPSTQLTDLTAETKYYARVRPDCDENLWSDICEFKPTNAISQTVCDGTTTNGYVPVYGNYAENYNKDEFIIPATTEGMAGMAGGTISKMTFYLSTPASDLWGAALYRVFMKEVNESSFASTSYYGTDGATIVYEGALDGTQSTMTIEFTTDYEYNGGNLLVGIYEYNKGSYKNCSFYGITSTNGALYKNNGTSLESITSGTLQNFIPKTTFTYLPCTTPKPKNLHVVDGSLWSGGATLAWEAPTSATPTSYQWRYKSDATWTAWESTTELSVALNLSSSTHYTFEVKAIYDGVGESAAIQTDFTTLDDCAFPTNLLAYTTPGQGTKATLTWVKGYDEENWVLQYGTDANFTDGTYTEKTSGFIPQTEPGLENVVAAVLTGLTAETHYYARVKATCSATSSSTWSNVVDFTPTNYVDFTYNETASSTNSYVPFYYYTTYATNQSQFIIPATALADVAGGQIRSITYYTSSTATLDFGGAEFDVYMAEVEQASFSTATFVDWTTLGTPVYSGTVSLANSKMTITFDDNFSYSGGNLLIGFKNTKTGSNSTSFSWTAVYNSTPGYTQVYQYGSNSANRNYYQPKVTLNYRPTPYVKIAAINEGTITSTSAELTWTAPETTATITGYYYQYKLSSAAEWPTGWHNLDANTTSVTLGGDLIPGTSYDFRIKVLYEGNHESAVTSTSFFTDCAVVTAFPWTEKFEGYPANTSTSYSETYKFNNPCWLNEHLLDGTGSSGSETWFQVYSGTTANNITNRLQLPDMKAGTQTELRLPEMTLATGTNYQFVIDVYRDNNDKANEGIRIYASANGNIAGAQELGFIPHYFNYAPTETETGWYTYEFAIPFTGTCYIIIVGESQWGTSTYMDNFFVEEIPTCARPTDLAKSEVTNHSATLTWTAGDTEQTLWQIAYSKTTFDPNTVNFDVTTVNTIDATSNPFTLDKILDAESTYYLYIRANCGTATEPDYGPWSRKGINLTTLGASPAPSNFTASNIGSQTADLVWTAGGGDYELSWDLYYVQSDDAPTAPTEETHATKTVTTLPTTENPYTLDGLREESRYYIWVRANHTINSVTTHSAWVALTGNFFTTLAACPTPTGLAYNNLTAVSADLSWVGSPDVTDYTVQYRTSAGMSTTVLSEHFDVSGVPTGWTKYTGLVDQVIDGTVTLSSTTSGWNTNTYALGTYNMKVNVYGSSCKYWLVTPEIELGTGNVLNFDLALTDYGNANVIEYPTQQPDDRFVVLVYADDAWHILREWNNSGSEYVYNTIATAGENVTIALSLYSGKTVKIAFYGESTVAGASSGVDDNDLHIDNVEVGTPTDAGEWITAVDDVETQSYQLTGLTGGVKYDVHVKSNCTSGEYCEPISFTTLAEGNMVFTNATNDGKWGNSGNWAPAQLPVLTDEVILRANATIESGCVAQAKQITFQGSPTPTLTIENGGQLQYDNTSTITATVKKTIAGYGEENFETNNGYVLFAPPFDKYIYNNNSDGTGLRNGTYDLYSWSRTDRPEWFNYGANNTSSLSMFRGTGYLYANQATTEVTFTGSIYGSGSKYNKYVYYTEPTANRFQDWNLIGNPFVCNAYLATETGTPLAYYKMNAAGNGFEAVTGAAIAPMEGVFYQATETGYVYFFRELPAGNIMPGNLNINLTQAVTTRGEQGATDNAIIRFGEGNTLGKFSFREGSSKVYIPMEGKDYAVVNAESQTGEIPVNFKAEKNGSYTLSFTSQEVSFSYLHLIDNLTGNDVDLLANPSYSFDAQTTDYANRFKLVFATGNSVDGDSFAFINGAGNLSIFGIEGTATVQVMDVLGHVLSSETFSGSYDKQLNVAPGVYMIRLINGNDVKVQKMIVK